MERILDQWIAVAVFFLVLSLIVKGIQDMLKALFDQKQQAMRAALNTFMGPNLPVTRHPRLKRGCIREGQGEGARNPHTRAAPRTQRPDRSRAARGLPGRFRLDARELLADVAEGVVYVNGERIKRVNEKAAAQPHLHTS